MTDRQDSQTAPKNQEHSGLTVQAALQCILTSINQAERAGEELRALEYVCGVYQESYIPFLVFARSAP